MSMCVLAWTTTVNFVASQTPADKASIVRAHKEPVECVRVCVSVVSECLSYQPVW